TQADFLDTPIVQDAVIHQIQVIGEAARRVSASFQAKSPAVPWRNIVGMRHKLVHDYMSVDLEAVWTTVQKHIPALRAEISQPIRRHIPPATVSHTPNTFALASRVAAAPASPVFPGPAQLSPPLAPHGTIVPVLPPPPRRGRARQGPAIA